MPGDAHLFHPCLHVTFTKIHTYRWNIRKYMYRLNCIVVNKGTELGQIH